MRINFAKTQMMMISRHQHKIPLSINGNIKKFVTRVTYLGTTLSEQWECNEEVKERIVRANTAFCKIKNLLFCRCLLCINDVETWSSKARTLNRIEAFKLCLIRRLLRVPWAVYFTNEVLRKSSWGRQLLDSLKHRTVSDVGHMLKGYSRPKLINNADRAKN